MQARSSILFLAIESILGPVSDGPAQAIKPTEQNGGAKKQRVTFNKDVAPIIFQRCAVCHSPGQAAPFNLLGYNDVKKRAKQIAKVVQKRYMPPWLPERGSIEFAND